MRKRILTILLLGIGPLAFASMVILFDPGTGRNLRRIDSADTLQYLGRTDALINPTLPTNALSLCYATNGQVLAIPQAWLDAEALAAWIANSNANEFNIRVEKTNAIKLALDFAYGTNGEQRFVRAMLLVIRQRMDQLSTNPSANQGAITTNSVLLAISNAIVADPR